MPHGPKAIDFFKMRTSPCIYLNNKGTTIAFFDGERLPTCRVKELVDLNGPGLNINPLPCVHDTP